MKARCRSSFPHGLKQRFAGLGREKGNACLPERTAQPDTAAARSTAPFAAVPSRGEPKYFVNAALHKPDAVILDLEDSVHPMKKTRRDCWFAMRCVPSISAGASAWCASTNFRWGSQDLEEIVPRSIQT